MVKKNILQGIRWLSLFWIVANMHIIITTYINIDIYPQYKWLVQCFMIAGPIIFGLIWLFIESNFFEDNIFERIRFGLESKSDKLINKLVLLFFNGISILITIGLIMLCFYVYYNFIEKGSPLT